MISSKNRLNQIFLKRRTLAARGAAAVAVIIAGYFGINPWLCSGCRRTCYLLQHPFPLPLSLVFFDKKMNKKEPFLDGSRIVIDAFLYVKI
jgi:hypothetical protein